LVTTPLKLPLESKPSFWFEFLRVQSDKFILLALIAFLHFTHAPENLQAAAIGGLIVLTQAQRFKIG
jgi:hypothetical protein